jgi:hypothetical protein
VAFASGRIAPARLFRAALAISLTVSALLFFVWSWHWPLVGDSALIHYIVFLIQRGWAPYRQLADQQFPGSYLIELAAMHIFGMGDLAWRLFDFSLLAAATLAFFAVTRSTNRSDAPCLASETWESDATKPGAPFMTASPSWVGFLFGSQFLPGLFAASLFILIHGRDGLSESGQRDLTMAVLLIAATAFLFAAVRKRSLTSFALFGLLSGAAFTIKPTVLPLTLAQLALAAYVLRHRGTPWLAPAISAALAYLVAPAIAVAFLLREHAVRAFIAGFHGIVPYYASLAHRPLSYVILHSVSPVLPLVLMWFGLLALNRRQPNAEHDWQRTALFLGVLFGLLDCILQARALPYYRYPLLAFLLPLMALDFTRALHPATKPGTPLKPGTPCLHSETWENSATKPGAPFMTGSPSWVGSSRLTSTLALIALSFGGFFLAPQSAILIHRYRWWETDFISSLQQNLNTLGGPALSGHIQCIDSISGCDTVLYRMRLEQSTGLLADYIVFGPDTVPIIGQTRQWVGADLLAYPPQVVVVSSWLHFDGPGNYQKLDRWPALKDFLATRYTLQTEWNPTRTNKWWGREETPASYRIYVLKPSPTPAAQ